MYDEIKEQLWNYKKYLHEKGDEWKRSLFVGEKKGNSLWVHEDNTPKAPLGIRDELKFVNAEILLWNAWSKNA